MNEVIERWERYVRETEKFALYPEAGTGSNLALAYAALGLVDEWQECDDARRAWNNSFNLDYDPGPQLEQNFIAEFGDYLWYAAANYRELRARAPGSTLGSVFQNAEHCWWTIAAENTHALAGRVKKLLRGDAPDRLLIQAGQCLQTTLDELLSSPYAIRAMDYNVEKLTSRRKRGVIRGDGDNR